MQMTHDRGFALRFTAGLLTDHAVTVGFVVLALFIAATVQG